MYNQYIALCVILVIAYAYLHYLFFYPCEWFKKSKYFNPINEYTEQCFIKCDEVGCGACDISLRGENYIVDGSEEVKKITKDCLLTYWGVTHFMLYVVIGFFCPDLFIQTLILGIGWEYYEYRVFNCHDTLDIVLNTAGFITGKAAREGLFTKKPPGARTAASFRPSL